MNSLSIAQTILENPSIANLQNMTQLEDLGKEIFQIARFTDRQLLDYAGSTGPPQFRSLMVAYRLLPTECAIKFVAECAFLVLPTATNAYPDEDVLVKLAQIRDAPWDQVNQQFRLLSNELDVLYEKSEVDERQKRSVIFEKLGRVPLEQGQEMSRVSGAISALDIACIIIQKQDSAKLFRNIDGMMPSLKLVYSNDDLKLGDLLIAKLKEIIEEERGSGSID